MACSLCLNGCVNRLVMSSYVARSQAQILRLLKGKMVKVADKFSVAQW